LALLLTLFFGTAFTSKEHVVSSFEFGISVVHGTTLDILLKFSTKYQWVFSTLCRVTDNLHPLFQIGMINMKIEVDEQSCRPC
jgi:hypothetical protein